MKDGVARRVGAHRGTERTNGCTGRKAWLLSATPFDAPKFHQRPREHMAAQVQDSSFITRRGIVAVSIVALHILLAWGLSSGLAQKVVEVLAPPIEADIVEEVKADDEPPPPPPPEMERPPVEVPPPEVSIDIPVEATSTAIVDVTDKPLPPAPPPPQIGRASCRER